MFTARTSQLFCLRALSGLIVVALCSVPLFGQCTLTSPTSWADGNSNWNNGINWSTGTVPNSSSTNVCITNGTSITPTTVTLDISATVASLQLASNNTLSANTGTTLSLGPQILNAGKLVFTGGSNTNTVLGLNTSTTLSGGGTLNLAFNGSGTGAAIIQQNVGGVTLTNASTIQGTGVIGNGGLTVVNQTGGKINANTSGAALTLNGGGGVTNAGLLEATGGGTLVVNTIVNNSGGNITGNGGTVQVVNATVQGGTLNTLSGGSIQDLGNSILDGATHGAVTLSKGSTYTVNTGNVVATTGTITDKGNIQLNGGNSNNALMGLNGNTTLNGGGTLTLAFNGIGTGGAIIQQNGGGITLTNQDTIQGTGTIGNGGLTLINATAGTLFASLSGQTLLVNGGGNITNNGTMKVATGALLHVTNGTFTNFSGTTLTGGTYNDSGTLEIDELGNTGGEIVTNAANIILNGASSSFVDGGGNNALSLLNTNASGSSFSITGGRNFTTAGNFTNNGTLTVGSNTSKFVVNGNLTNFNSVSDTLTGGTYNVTGALQFNGANVVNNAANITLTGASSKIVDQSSANGLANFATNTGTFGLAGGRNFTTAGNFTNNGTLTVGMGSTFDVNGNLSNFSGTTLTGGIYGITGTLQFNGANIVTNAANITLTGASSKIVNQTSANALAGLASNASSGSFTINGGRSFTTAGSFTNAGILNIASGSTFAIGGGGSFTQSGGTTTDDGVLSSTGAVTLQAGALFGKGNITGNVQSSAVITPGDSSTKTGILTETGAYSQSSTGTLDISIGGTTAGTNFDELNPTTANLNGTLNISRINGFVPNIGATFKIMNFGSETGAFSTVNGLSINSTRHFSITYQGKDVLLTVVAGAAPVLQTRIANSRPLGLWTKGNLVAMSPGMLKVRAFSGAGPATRFELASTSAARNRPLHLLPPAQAAAIARIPRMVPNADFGFAAPLFRSAGELWTRGLRPGAGAILPSQRRTISGSNLATASFAVVRNASNNLHQAFSRSGFRPAGAKAAPSVLHARSVTLSVPLTNFKSKANFGFTIE